MTSRMTYRKKVKYNHFSRGSVLNKHHELPFKTYDRLIPTQDSLPKGGFGNLIALPLQKHPRAQEKSLRTQTIHFYGIVIFDT